MKLRVGNACWHAFHVQHAAVALEAGYFAQEGIDVERMDAPTFAKFIEEENARWAPIARSSVARPE